MNNLFGYGIAVIGGICMFLGWPMMPLFFFLFVGFVTPFLLIELGQSIESKRKSLLVFSWLYLFLLVWNFSTAWWISNVDFTAGIFANFANAFLMSVPLMMGRYVWLMAGRNLGYFATITLWLGFEYVHLNWELTWAWLTLGNGFAYFPSFIQWYEFTGPLGGSLWILLVSLFGFHFILRPFIFLKLRPKLISYVYFILLVLIPVSSSAYIYSKHKFSEKSVEVAVIQPNIDPFNEKFADGDDYIPKSEQVARLKSLSERVVTSNTEYLLWPETSFDIEGTLWEVELDYIQEVIELRQWLKKYPDLTLMTGATTFRGYGFDESRRTATSRFYQGVGFFDVYNTAITLKADRPLQLYHKSKLVPGVERMPYPEVFRFLESLVIDLGGASGSLGTQINREVYCNQNEVCTTPCICYESIFAEFMSEGVLKGAQFISIITNDGWWGNSPGHRQHAAYASLLAISSRRAIARAANTGISCFVNSRGDISRPSAYWTQDAMVDQIELNDHITYYVQNGDYIGRLAGFLGIFLFLSVVVKHITTRRSLKKQIL